GCHDACVCRDDAKSRTRERSSTCKELHCSVVCDGFGITFTCARHIERTHFESMLTWHAETTTPCGDEKASTRRVTEPTWQQLGKRSARSINIIEHHEHAPPRREHASYALGNGRSVCIRTRRDLKDARDLVDNIHVRARIFESTDTCVRPCSREYEVRCTCSS